MHSALDQATKSSINHNCHAANAHFTDLSKAAPAMVTGRVEHTPERLRAAAHPNSSPTGAALGRSSLLVLGAAVVVVAVVPPSRSIPVLVVGPLRLMALQAPVAAERPSLPVLNKMVVLPTQFVRQIGAAPPVRMTEPLHLAGDQSVAVAAVRAKPHARLVAGIGSPVRCGQVAAVPATLLAADHSIRQQQRAGRLLN